MANILVITTKYSGKSSANGICAKNIVSELSKKGNNVYVLCYENSLDEDGVYSIRKKSPSAKSNLFFRILITIKSLFCALIDHTKVGEYTQYAVKLCEEKKIDIVVCFFFPVETVAVLGDIKQKFPKINTLIYELDSIGDGIFATSKLRYFATKSYEKWLTQNYVYADKIVVMKSHENYWNRVWGRKFGSKLLISDIPTLIDNKINIEAKQSFPFCFLYAGELNRSYRSPKYLLKLLKHLSKSYNIEVKFYTKGNCEKIIRNYNKNNSFIHQCGFVSSEYLEKEIANSDMLLSIGNKKSNSVPSKIINYLSYGKPILHIASQRDDVCGMYLDNYPLGLVLYENNSIAKNVDLLSKFLVDVQRKFVNFDELFSKFEMNTPRFSSELIESSFKRNSDEGIV